MINGLYAVTHVRTRSTSYAAGHAPPHLPDTGDK
jgi:hypothetical protein